MQTPVPIAVLLVDGGAVNSELLAVALRDAEVLGEALDIVRSAGRAGGDVEVGDSVRPVFGVEVIGRSGVERDAPVGGGRDHAAPADLAGAAGRDAG
mgnify:CR=1 FL=1